MKFCKSIQQMSLNILSLKDTLPQLYLMAQMLNYAKMGPENYWHSKTATSSLVPWFTPALRNVKFNVRQSKEVYVKLSPRHFSIWWATKSLKNGFTARKKLMSSSFKDTPNMVLASLKKARKLNGSGKFCLNFLWNNFVNLFYSLTPKKQSHPMMKSSIADKFVSWSVLIKGRRKRKSKTRRRLTVVFLEQIPASSISSYLIIQARK